MGLFQPDFIWVPFRSMMPRKYNRSDADIKIAANKWRNGPVDISGWDVSSLVSNGEIIHDTNSFVMT